MDVMNTPPNEVRNFVHKRIGRAVKGFVTSGFNPVTALTGFLAPTDAPRTRFGRPKSKAVAQAAKFNPRFETAGFGRGLGLPCIIPGQRRVAATGKCEWFLGSQPGIDDPERVALVGRTPIGDTVMGQYGAGELPGNHVINRAVCRRGMLLGTDGVCYNRSQISNKERLWPRGRRPLLTGGDMRAISTAARAGRRLEGATKRLQKIGLMKKPARGVSRRQIAAEIRTEMHQK